MMRLEHLSEALTRAHAGEQLHRLIHKVVGLARQHSTEVVVLQVFPDRFDVVELFGRVRRQPEGPDQVFHPSQSFLRASRRVSRSVVEDQDDSLARAVGSFFQLGEHAQEVIGVDGPGSVAESERSVRPTISSLDRDASIRPGCGNPKRFSSLAIGVGGYGEKIEPDSIGEPEFVVGALPLDPFFSLWSRFWALSFALGSCRFRMVRLVLRQTNPWVRRSSETQLAVRRTPVVRAKYSARRGAVHRVKANPNDRGSTRTVRTMALMYLGDATGGLPVCGLSSRPKTFSLSQRCFQLSSVRREIDNASRTFRVGIPEPNKSNEVIRSEAFLDLACRLRRVSARRSDGDRAIRITSGMYGFPSLSRGAYHAAA